MEDFTKIKTALVSVYHKDGLDEILKTLAADGVRFISTGGTASFIESLGLNCTTVESITGYPSILGGRVKTLHPKVFGGILSRRDNDGDNLQSAQYEIPAIDLVIVDLYPFVETVKGGGTDSEIIEKIDIGGISLIRAAAKNFRDVVIIPSKNSYAPLLDIIKENGAKTTLEQRRAFATEAFAVSSAYDSAIFNWFAGDNADALRLPEDGVMNLRYGENPHQAAKFFGKFDDMFTKLHGKEISYNNLLDIDAAVNLINDFDETTFAILKHNNACGIASRETVKEAWEKALACDPVSAFGGVLVTNGKIDAPTAELIDKIFFEVLIAPEYTPEALEILEKKKNRIILVANDLKVPAMRYRSALNGILAQQIDASVETPADFKLVTKTAVKDSQIDDLVFANKVVKHSKSNAIVLAKDKALLASGIGQTSRVDSLKQAIEKATSFGFDLKGGVMASDAFFPFADCVEIAHNAGIDAVVQPGGSIRDQESVDYCDANGIAMVMTGVRHFRH